jgi:hypothetical protein
LAVRARIEVHPDEEEPKSLSTSATRFNDPTDNPQEADISGQWVVSPSVRDLTLLSGAFRELKSLPRRGFPPADTNAFAGN